jgi:glucan biosynthesis protein C
MNRNHALDNLRGILMWLGIVLHVAVNHMQAPSMLPWRDSDTSPVADLIVLLIHAFRMPAFFMLAGFFAAGMLARRGAWGMLKNRLRRIGLPFVLFFPVMAVVIGCLAVVFRHVMQWGDLGFDPGLMPRRADGQLPVGRMHLWFLFDLLWLYAASAVLVRVLPATPAWAARLVSSWWGALLLTLPLALIGAMYKKGILTLAVAFTPDLAELVHFGLFYAAGWVMYAQREAVMPRLQHSCGRHGLAGLIGFIGALALLKSHSAPPALNAFFYNGAAWFWSLALIGAFLKYSQRQRPWMRYLADSSYWVYLFHMVCTVGFGIVLYNAPLGFGGKMVVNIAATTVVCLLSYHYLVRNTWLGVLLNGTRKAAPPSAAIHGAAAHGETS